jgi:hypothetical protein
MRVIVYNSGLGPKIPLGEKTSTIRGKARCKPGDILSHRIWSGKPYRSKQIELCQTICKAVQRVRITWEEQGVTFYINDRKIDHPGEIELLAKQEGFESVQALKDYFKKSAKLDKSRHPKPFEGEMIEW